MKNKDIQHNLTAKFLTKIQIYLITLIFTALNEIILEAHIAIFYFIQACF
jgi:hypothetical protein